MPEQAVLLLAHGTPETVEQIPEYLRNVVSGRPLPQAVVEEIQHRYALIGRSPLTEITMEQARLVETELAALGQAVPVYVGMRNWRPYIPDVVRQMRADGVEEAAVEAGGLRIDFTAGWAQHPLLAEAFAERLRPLLAKLTAEAGAPIPVLFTAHSVPCRTIQTPAAGDTQPRLWPGEGADPYAEEAKHTAVMVAERVPGIPQWWFAFQSQGVSGGPWIGPTVESTLDSIAAGGVKMLILQPIGFLCDHVEILFDVDHLFREYAVKLGVRLERPESLNASVTLARAVAELAGQGLARFRR
jgi:ferrochelatase